MPRYACSIAIGILSLCFVPPQAAKAQAYTDTFEASSFNPFWTVAQQQGGTIGLCSGQNHTPGGQQSGCFSAQGAPGQKNLFLTHQYASPAQGDFSVWFYDSGQTYYNFLNLSNSATGLSASVGTMDFDPTCYAAALDTPLGRSGPNATCGPYPQLSTTNVQRTIGWHKLEIDVAASSLSILIDGVQVLNVPVAYGFDLLTLEMFGPEALAQTTYFDDFVQTMSSVPVGSPAPTLTSISPNSGTTGTSVNVNLTGSNFASGATVNVSNTGMTISNVNVVNANQIAATFFIGANAASGAANVTVTTSSGTSNPVTFTINPPTPPAAPILTSISPNSGTAGASVNVNLTGSNFVSGATVNVSNAGVTVNNVNVVNPDQINATFFIPANAASGAANVTVTTSGGTSSPVSFTIDLPTPSAPTLAFISPNSGIAGASVNVTLTGSNFAPGATVNVSNPGVIVSNVNVANANQITATFLIQANAASGATNVTVSTSAGTSGPVSFSINTPGPSPFNFTDNFEASSFNPFWTVAQQQGGTIGLCSGQNHTPGGQQSGCFSAQGAPGQKNLFLTHQYASPAQGDFSVWFYDSGQTYYNFLNLSNSATGLSASVGTMDFDPTCYAAALDTPLGRSGPNATCGPYPQLSTTNVQRTIGWHKLEIDVAASSLSILIDGVQVLNVPVAYGFDLLTLEMFGPEALAQTTYFDDFVQTTSSVPVGPLAPTLTSISPNSGTAGTSVNVTLTGSNFVSGASVNVSNAGVTISNVNVVSPTQIAATFTIAANAASGPANVTVTTSGSTTNPVSFSINLPTPSVQTLASITPNSATAGTSLNVTLTGSNFLPGATVNVSNVGVAVSNVNVVSPTQITATFTIAAIAPSGAINVSVTTSSGTSGPLSFTINPPGAAAPIQYEAQFDSVFGWCSAEGGGGGIVDCNRPTPSTWETFYLTDVNGGGLISGDEVSLQASNGDYVTAEGGGGPGSLVDAYRTTHGLWERWIIVTVDGHSVIKSGDQVELRTYLDGTYFSSNGGGQHQAAADRTSAGSWEQFTLVLAAPPPPTLISMSSNSGVQGATVAVTLAGTNFFSGASVNVANAGVAVTNVAVVSSTQITAIFAIAGTAAPGTTNVTVSTSGGVSGPVSFIINPSGTTSAPTLYGAQFDSIFGWCSAVGGGGGIVDCNSDTPSTWETFTLTDVNGGDLISGDEVSLQASNGDYVTAEGGGGLGSLVDAYRTTHGLWERWIIVAVDGHSVIKSGDQVELRTYLDSTYFSSNGGGQHQAAADRTSAGPWEQFTLVLGAAPPPPTCTFSIQPTAAVFNDTGGDLSVLVTSPAQCGWTAQSNTGWLSIKSGASATGPGTVVLHAAPNTGSSLSGSATIAGQTFSAKQDAGACGALDISALMSVAGGLKTPLGSSPFSYSEPFTVTNNSGATMDPVWLLIHFISPNDTVLLGDQAITTCFSKTGDFLVFMGALQPGASSSVPVIISTPNPGVILYSTRVLEGTPGDVNPTPGPGSGIVSPQTASLTVSQQQQFTTSISGGVSWSINPPVGFISDAGLYTAPNSVTQTSTITITASSVTNASQSGIATVTLNRAITPPVATLAAKQSQQFATLITGGVSWTIVPPVGSISTSGLYTAPSSIAQGQTVLVTATSLVDSSQYTALVTLTPDPVVNPSVESSPVITSLNPASLLAGETSFMLTVSGMSFVPGSIVEWNGSGLSTTFVSAGQLSAVVPASLVAAPGNATVSVINPSAAVSSSISFTIAAGPTITGVVNGASFASGPVAPGEIVTVFGTGFGPTTPAGLQLDSRNQVSTLLTGMQIFFDGIPAPILGGQAGQMTAVVPYEFSGQDSVQVQLSYQGLKSGIIQVDIGAAAPGIFTRNSSGGGQGIILNPDGSLNSSSNPAPTGSIVTLYATGEGQTSPAGIDGKLDGSPAPTPNQAVTATVGGINALVQYAGGVKGAVAGLLQVNVQIPPGAATGGSVPIVITVGGQSSQGNVTLAIR